MAGNTIQIWKMKIHCAACFLGCFRRELKFQAGDIWNSDRYYFRGRSLIRKTNFKPDHTSSTTQTFTSTSPLRSPISRAMFSFKSVGTFEAPFGHEIQSEPFDISAFLSIGKDVSRLAFSFVKN